jgi:tetratricopeptide (TPR) repeat protein
MMRWIWLSLAIVAVGLAATPANAQGPRAPGAEQADIHNPFSPRYVDMAPDLGYPGADFYWQGGAPYAPGYDPWYEPYGWQYFGDPYWSGPIILPPLWIGAEELYGPQAMGRFLGYQSSGQALPIGVREPDLADPIPNARPDADEADIRPKVRISNAQALARGHRFIGFGDEQFRRQNHAGAYDRYKKASAAAPDLEQAYFRQAFALVALGRHEMAAAALRRGLRFQPDWARTRFWIGELYGDNQRSKTAHLEALAEAVAEQPENADLLFLLGVWLYCDRQPERARNFFLHARELEPGGVGHITAFLDVMDEQPAAAADALGAGEL